MLDIGWGEIFVLALLGLLVLGPRELPGFLRQLGRFWQRVRMQVFTLRQNLSLMDRPAEMESWILGEADSATEKMKRKKKAPAARRKPNPHASPRQSR